MATPSTERRDPLLHVSMSLTIHYTNTLVQWLPHIDWDWTVWKIADLIYYWASFITFIIYLALTEHIHYSLEQKEPVKITIPRHEKIVKPGSPPRRRSDAGHFQMTSPVSKAPMSKTTPSKAPAGSHAGGSSTSKKKTVSRREELLLQLQAVEDAIAKKRSKMQ